MNERVAHDVCFWTAHYAAAGPLPADLASVKQWVFDLTYAALSSYCKVETERRGALAREASVN
jgi:hypothetical protein